MYIDLNFYKIGKIQKLKVTKISEKENDTEKELSEEIKKTNEEIKRNYYKSLVMVIIAPIIVVFVWYYIGYIYMLFFGIPIVILIEFYGIFGIITYKFRLKQKISEETKITDEDLKLNYYKSLLLVIFTPIIAIPAFIFYFTGFLLGFLVIIPLGIIIGLYGLSGVLMNKFKPEKYREILEKKRSSERMESTRKHQSLYIIEFIIGFSLAGIGILVILTVFFCTTFMQLYCDLLFPAQSFDVFYGLHLSIIALSIGLTLIIDGYLRFKRIRIIQIKVRNHLPLESVPAKVSGKKSCTYCCFIYIIGVIVSVVLFLLIY